MLLLNLEVISNLKALPAFCYPPLYKFFVTPEVGDDESELRVLLLVWSLVLHPYFTRKVFFGELSPFIFFKMEVKLLP